MNRIFGLSCALLLATFASASTLYPEKMLTIQDKDNNNIGMITPLTPLTKIEEKGDMVKISLNGWSAYGAQTVVFQKVGVRIMFATINEDFVKDVKKGETVVDDYESEWSAVTLEGWVKKEQLLEDKQKIEDDATTLFNERCGACHQAHPADEFTANQWPNIIKSMKDRGGLSTDEEWLLIRYMQINANDMK